MRGAWCTSGAGRCSTCGSRGGGSKPARCRSGRAERSERFDWRPAFAVALVLAGTVSFTVGAVATLWPVWAVGLVLVAASFLVFEL